MLVLAIAAAVLLYFSYLLLGPTNIPTVSEVSIQSETLQRGDTLVYSYKLDKKTNNTSIISRSIACDESSAIIKLEQSIDNYPVGSHLIIDSVVIPTTSPTGKCHIVFNTDYEINVLRHETISYITECFTII